VNQYSGCAIHVGQQIPYLIALCPFSMYQTDAISAVRGKFSLEFNVE
jgi:hypothetical protein